MWSISFRLWLFYFRPRAFPNQLIEAWYVVSLLVRKWQKIPDYHARNLVRILQPVASNSLDIPVVVKQIVLEKWLLFKLI